MADWHDGMRRADMIRHSDELNAEIDRLARENATLRRQCNHWQAAYQGAESHRCGACTEGRHVACSGWCRCPCDAKETPAVAQLQVQVAGLKEALHECIRFLPSGTFGEPAARRARALLARIDSPATSPNEEAFRRMREFDDAD